MTIARRTRFFFFLNPHADVAVTRCPKCEAKTKQRKIPLVVHIEPQTLCVLNKTCRFCPACQLVIARQSEIEPLLQAMVDDEHPVLEQGKYMAIGTLDRGDWRAGQKERWSTVEAINRAWVFKDHWNFVVQNAWGPAHDSSAP